MPYVDKAVNRNITLMKIRPPETQRLAYFFKINNFVFGVLVHKNISFLIVLVV